MRCLTNDEVGGQVCKCDTGIKINEEVLVVEGNITRWMAGKCKASVRLM